MTSTPTPAQHGIIAAHARADEVAAAGSDYLEQSVVGSLLVEHPTGEWGPAAGLAPVPPAPSFAMLCPGTMRVSDPAVPLAETETYLRAAFAAIAPWARPGATVVLGSGGARRIPEGVSRADGEQRFAGSVRLARDHAAEQGLEVLLEPLHQGETDLVNTLEQGAAFLDTHDLSDVRMVADLFHVMLEDESLETVQRLAGRVGHAHIADTDRRPPGQGDWPLAEFLTALRDGGYAGHVSIECFTWEDLAVEGRAALAAVREADPAV
ncbi:sugar phosphate isomerase/epimerase family protein [Brachybacterium sp. J144]|uniref:sugar phosphate isomerase/epimerase family protein n=1 Tax=Brachybacterium sp. J144 TaxID=3116487 RepID=UPI002E7735B7|nr:sugar phosphate isomerase/epimerase family protein [Brachybacterium sp. J144]MEE1650603.1 sugar phosphate isomerase/epimerase family protein [Brachybacterium sp. J144]